MEGLFHGDNAIPVGLPLLFKVPPGQLDGRLIGFGPAITEKNPIGEAVSDQSGSQFHLRLSIIQVGNVNQRVGLGAEDFGDSRVGMSQAAHGDSGYKIEILPAFGIPETIPLALIQKKGLPLVGGGQNLVRLMDDLIHASLSLYGFMITLIF